MERLVGLNVFGLNVDRSFAGGRGLFRRDCRREASCTAVCVRFSGSPVKGLFFPADPVSSSATVSPDISNGPQPPFASTAFPFSWSHLSGLPAASEEVILPSFSHITPTLRAGNPMSCCTCSIFKSSRIRRLIIRKAKRAAISRHTKALRPARTTPAMRPAAGFEDAGLCGQPTTGALAANPSIGCAYAWAPLID